MERLKNPVTLLCLGAIATIMFVGKSFYSDASAGDLSFILGPTGWLVGHIVGASFVFEVGAGWLSRDEMFNIAPVCAGINFLLAAFLMVSLASTWRLSSATARLCAIPLSLLLAYVATLVVNTIRIVIALRAHTLGSSLFMGDALHRAQGITVFFVALYLLYFAADRALPKGRDHGR